MAEKIIDYVVISDTDLVQLRKDILEYLEGGWEPVGGLAIERSTTTSYYRQAMVLKSKNRSN